MKLQKHLTRQEKQMLFRLARQKRGGIAAEIGSYVGASSCFIGHGLAATGARLYCIDPWSVEYVNLGGQETRLMYEPGGRVRRYYVQDGAMRFEEIPDPGAECPSYSSFLRNTHSLRDVIVPLRGLSQNMVSHVPEDLDLLFIDGWHEYDAVRRDCEQWMIKLKPDGIVILHDYDSASGVRKVVEEYVKPRCRVYDSLPNMFWGKVSGA
jgi:predicted O-methyltransferase YrrM